MHPTKRTSLIFIGACLVASVQARAQPLFPHAQSIECTVANTDLIFIAKLVKFGDAEKVDGREVHQATIAIEETLKQDLFTIEPYKLLSVYIPASASVLADWTKRSPRLLVAHDNDAPKATVVLELIEDKMEVMKSDMTLLRDPDDVIKAAKDAVRRMPVGVRRIHTFGLKVPRERIAGTSWAKFYETGGHLVLSVPVDKQLEKRAQDYLRAEDFMKRAEGARALRHFKSDENIARIKALLDDPGRTFRDQGNEGREVFYVVRHYAYETLKTWNVDVKRPVIREVVRE